MSLMFQCEKLRCDYAKRIALQGISLEISEGAYVAVIGPNGSGKSTLLRALAGLHPLAAGRLRIQGEEITAMDSRERARQVAWVPQVDEGSFPFVVQDFVMMGRYPHLSPFTPVQQTDRAAVDEAMRLAGVKALADRRVDQLSGGERRRVLIAAALAQQTRALLLDEPDAYLDPAHAAEVQALLRRLNQEQRLTVVVVTHDLNGMVRDAGLVLCLKDGKMKAFESADQVLTQGRLEQLFDHGFDKLYRQGEILPYVVPRR